MNIKEAIEKGLYPVDSKGRALVPAENNRYGNILIAITDAPGLACLIGWPTDQLRNGMDGGGLFSFDKDGKNYQGCGDMRLLPPPPRKVKVVRHAIIRRTDVPGFEATFITTTAKRPERLDAGEIAVELTGEYEEEWK